MISAESSIKIKAPIEKVFDVIADFAVYPEFQPNIVSAKILKSSAKSATVAFEMKMFQIVNYTLKFSLKPPHEITWTFVEGDSIFKSNEGFWKLEEKGKGTVQVTYRVDVDLSMWIPSSIAGSLLNEELPKMLEGFKERVEKYVRRTGCSQRSCLETE